MILSGVVIAGGLSAGTFGVVKYRENKRKKKFPWTVAAERMANNQLVLGKRKKARRAKDAAQEAKKASPLLIGASLAALTKSVREVSEKLSLASVGGAAFSSDLRNQQLEELSSAPICVSEAEKKANQEFVLSSALVGLISVGNLFYPPLSLLSVPGLVYLSRPYYTGTYQAVIKERRVSISILDAVFATGALITGHFFVLSVGNWFYYLSRKLLVKSEDHSQQSLINVFGTPPRFVWVQKEGTEIEVAFDTISKGDIIVISAGEMVPVDGMIMDGQALVDQRMLTGESQPAEKEMGERVFAGTMVLSGRILVEVEKAGADTVAAQIGDILTNTADFKSFMQSRWIELVDKLALPILALSAVAWPVAGLVGVSTICNAAFAYNMRVLAPIGMLNHLNLASQRGILIKDGRSLDLLTQVDTVVFDKTGTLTQEIPTVSRIYPEAGYSERELLRYAAAAEYRQTHPIALAILAYAKEQGIAQVEMSDVHVELGYGIKAQIDGKSIRVGSPRFMDLSGITIGTNVSQKLREGHEDGYSMICIAIDQKQGGIIELRPTIRPEAKQMTQYLRQRQMSMVIISGDHQKPTQKLAEELGIENYFAETLPENKAELIEQLQNEGRTVCFVGDGINDSIALKKANVSISLSGASTIATDTAQIILMDGNLKQLENLFDLAQGFENNMNNTLITSIVPGFMTISGVFFLHFGLASSVILNNLGLMAGLSNVMWPLLSSSENRGNPHCSAL